MPELANKRSFESRTSTANARLVSTAKPPSLDEITPERFARLNQAQKKEMVDKLIDFLKSI